jgi:hypothetical protein
LSNLGFAECLKDLTMISELPSLGQTGLYYQLGLNFIDVALEVQIVIPAVFPISQGAEDEAVQHGLVSVSFRLLVSQTND